MPNSAPTDSLDFSAIGTHWHIDAGVPIGPGVEATIRRRIDEYDAVYSRFRADSLVTRAAEAPGTHTFPDDASDLFALYDALEELTDGAVNPLVGTRLDELGYGRGYRLTAAPAAAERRVAPSWSASLARRGTTITTHPQAGIIDVGAAGKGHLVDIVTELLVSEGYPDLIVDAGGDIRRHGPAVRIALENPFDATEALGVVEVANASVCGSAVNRRAWGDGLHHVIDARTGQPTRTVVATWAIAERALVADGLATALFFADPLALESRFDFSWVRVFADGTLTYSDQLPGTIF